jgi:hypothetical protein
MINGVSSFVPPVWLKQMEPHFWIGIGKEHGSRTAVGDPVESEPAASVIGLKWPTF